MVGAEIKNLIFDLGGVIINLSVDSTYHAFSQLSGKSIQDLKDAAKEVSFFNDYEKGLIDDADFRKSLREFLQIEAHDHQLDDAWNAMLLDIPHARIELLKRLRNQYQLFLLSNTNNIHLQCFTNIVKDTLGETSLDIYFDKSYYSHLMKMRKPDSEIYQQVLSENSLHANETLFLDDNLSNLEGAQTIGIKTFHVHHPDQLFPLFT